MAAQRLAGLKLTMMDATILPPGLLVLCYNRPKTLNSMPDAVYYELAKVINWAAKEDEVSAVLLTARGRLFSSGRDMSIEAIDDILNDKAKPDPSKLPVRETIDAMIDFPKLLIAGINGPAFGIAVTTLALFDLVYASPTATFTTPFTTLGLSPEGCSSYTFPRVFGNTMANRLLHLAETITAQEMLQNGFVKQIVQGDGDSFADNVTKLVQKSLEPLSPQTIRITKQLTRPEEERRKMKEVNLKEMQVLAQNSGNQFQKNSMRKHKERVLAKRNRSKL